MYHDCMSAWRFLLVISLAVLPPIFAHAHSEGQSFEVQTDTYFVDIGYDLPLQENQETLIDFGLFTLNNNEPDELASFTNVTMRIHSGSTILYERSIDKPEFGKAFATVTPKKFGHWTLTADFSTNDTLIQSSSFDVLISQPSPSDRTEIPVIVIFTVVITLLVGTAVFVFELRPTS